MEAPIQQDSTEVQTETPSVPQTTDTPNGYQPQSVTPSPVESGQPTSQDNARSQEGFETARQIKNLMKEIRSLKQSFETRSPSQSSVPQPPPQVTREELLADPLSAIRKMIDAQTSKVREELPQVLQQRESEWRAEQARQEGLRLIKTNELIKKDPQGSERMEQILLEEDDDGNSLEKLSYTHPKYAAQIALERYQHRHGQVRGTPAPSKAQMTSTATAQTSGAGRSTTEAEIGEIYAQLARMPELMKDPKFMAKLDAVMLKSKEESLVGK